VLLSRIVSGGKEQVESQRKSPAPYEREIT